MRAIFISYRREDSEGHAGRLYESLADHFGRDAVFMDVVAIEPGRDFRSKQTATGPAGGSATQIVWVR